MDEESVLIYLELELEDTLELLKSQKGKQKDGQFTALEEALKLNAVQLEATITSYKDRRMAQSISRAIQDDAPTLAAEIAQEAQAERDRITAATLSGHPALSRRGSTASTTDIPSGDIIKRLRGLNIFKDNDTCSLIGDDEDNDTGEGPSRLPTHECVACSDRKPAVQTYSAPCLDTYCATCLIQLFEDSLVDGSLFPPRCCRQDMAISDVRVFLGPELTHRVELKAIEHNTVDKTYCSNRTCSTFILPTGIIDNRGKCTVCDTETCVRCKEHAHVGNCEQARDDVVLALAQEQGWRRCFGCQAIVELNTGCNHITCRCHAEFCYVCGERWKTCTCAQWDEARLLERATDVVARRPAIVAGGVMAAIERMAGHLRDRHECDHEGRWVRVGGAHRCEECRHNLPNYILECRQCHLRACLRCRQNRL